MGTKEGRWMQPTLTTQASLEGIPHTTISQRVSEGRRDAVWLRVSEEVGLLVIDARNGLVTGQEEELLELHAILA
jgi:hypothetical protein